MENEIAPQKGYQTKSLSSEADIVIGGGVAGAGKTYSLLLDPMRGIHLHDFRGVIFRRTTPQITLGGGLWDTSMNLYYQVGGEPKVSGHKWIFPSKAQIQFSHMEYEKDKLSHQGSAYAFIGFDELTHFTYTQFLYLLSRNRSTCGIKPYIRATCNPDPESWVKDVIEWWIDEDGYPIEDRDGVIRFFVNDKNHLVWGDSKQEVIDKCPHIFNFLKESEDPNNYVKSITFIAGHLEDNIELISKDPMYKANLMMQSESEKKSLLYGCWKAVQDDQALVNYKMLPAMFSNFPKESNNSYITCDVARFGRDLAIIGRWTGWACGKILIFTKSSTKLLRETIEGERSFLNIPVTNVVVDQDGVGGGLVDEGGYVGFSNGGAVMKDPATGIKENYQNLKTQCYYRMIEENINTGEFSVDLDEIYVDGIRTQQIKIGQKVYDIRRLIMDDIKAIKRARTDKEGKKQINSKEEQKNLLGGRSPDFGDMFMMRKYPDLAEPESYDFIGF